MNEPIKDKILALAARPEGIKSCDIPGMTMADVSTLCCTFVNRGLLYRAGAGRGKVRYFSTAKAALEFDAATIKAGVKTSPNPHSRATFSKNAETVFPPGYKVTPCPSYKPRFEAVELPFVFAGNSRGRVASEAT